MTTTEWTDNVPAQRDEADPLASFELEIVPKEEPASPTALAWIDRALGATDSRGRVAPVKDQAVFETVRAALRKAAAEREITVTCTPEKDKKGNIVALTFTVGGRRGRKSAE